jgi:hypothetical protein
MLIHKYGDRDEGRDDDEQFDRDEDPVHNIVLSGRHAFIQRRPFSSSRVIFSSMTEFVAIVYQD